MDNPPLIVRVQFNELVAMQYRSVAIFFDGGFHLRPNLQPLESHLVPVFELFDRARQGIKSGLVGEDRGGAQKHVELLDKARGARRTSMDVRQVSLDVELGDALLNSQRLLRDVVR